MADRGTVVWAPDPFNTDAGNSRPWLVVSSERMPYPDEESIAVAFSTQSHHAGSFAVPSDAWIRGEPGQQSFVLQPVACAKLSGVWCPDMDVINQICPTEPAILSGFLP